MGTLAGYFIRTHNEEAIKTSNRLIEYFRRSNDFREYKENKKETFGYIAAIHKHESSQEKIYFSPKQGTLLIGRAFHNFSPSLSQKTLSEKDCLSILEQENFASSLWGRYQAIKVEKGKECLNLYRDPTGLSPLYFYDNGSYVLFSSQISLIYDVLLSKPEFDWAYLHSFLAYGHHSSSRTPFQEIYELTPGYKLELSKSQAVTKEFWIPYKTSEASHNQESKPQLLVETLKYCVSAWLENSPEVCLEFSGGIDSSALLMACKEQNLPVHAVNYGHLGIPFSNESYYAQSLTSKLGTRLTDIDLEAVLPLSAITPLGRYNRPFPSLLDHRLDNKIRESLLDAREGEFINGYGGDHLFLAAPSIEFLADYFYQRHSIGFFKKARQLSMLLSIPYLSILSQSFKKILLPISGEKIFPFYKAPSWVTEEFNPFSSFFEIPYKRSLGKILPGQKKQLWHFYHSFSYIDQSLRAKDKPIIHPFLSQPIVELALSMPNFNSFTAHYDRFPFRKACFDHFKDPIFWRRSKGEVTGVIIQGITRNINNVKQLALDGIMAKNNIINRQKLEARIKDITEGKMHEVNSLVNLLAIEVWAHSWEASTLNC